jgi:hypothetical protein
MAFKSSGGRVRLEIDPVIESVQQITERVRRELPSHAGLVRAAVGVTAAACEAKIVSRSLRRPWGWHRLPALFLAASLICFATWSYFRFLHVSRLRIAVPDRDAVLLHQRIEHSKRVQFEEITTVGSRASVALVDRGDVDLAFVQGGIPIPADLPRWIVPGSEEALLFLRDSIDQPTKARVVLTSVEGQGSHSVALVLADIWGSGDQLRFVHDWTRLTDEPDFAVPAEVDAVFVIKDLGSEKLFRAARKLAAAGFRLASLQMGARALSLDYLQTVEVPAGFLLANPTVPAEPITTYTVSTFLVARRGLTPRLMAAAAHLVESEAAVENLAGFEPNVSDTSELLQGVEAFLSILVYIGLAFLALLGWEIATYRRRFNELNTLISLISMHQSNKDVLGLRDPAKLHENLLYLGLCSDLLGIISVITGYYSQENASLLYNKLLEIIHHRCNGLKINIQLKIFHATITLADIPPPSDGAGADGAAAANGIRGEEIDPATRRDDVAQPADPAS